LRGHRAVTAGLSGSAIVWDLVTGQQVARAPLDSALTTVAVAGDEIVDVIGTWTTRRRPALIEQQSPSSGYPVLRVVCQREGRPEGGCEGAPAHR